MKTHKQMVFSGVAWKSHVMASLSMQKIPIRRQRLHHQQARTGLAGLGGCAASSCPPQQLRKRSVVAVEAAGGGR